MGRGLAFQQGAKKLNDPVELRIAPAYPTVFDSIRCDVELQLAVPAIRQGAVVIQMAGASIRLAMSPIWLAVVAIRLAVVVI